MIFISRNIIEILRSKLTRYAISSRTFFSVLFAYPVSPQARGNEPTGIQPEIDTKFNTVWLTEKTSLPCRQAGTSLSLTVTLSGVEGCLHLAFIEDLAKLKDIDT